LISDNSQTIMCLTPWRN